MLLTIFCKISWDFRQIVHTEDKASHCRQHDEDTSCDSPISNEVTRPADQQIAQRVENLYQNGIFFPQLRMVILCQKVETKLHSSICSTIQQKEPKASHPNINGADCDYWTSCHHTIEQDHQRSSPEAVHDKSSQEDTHQEAEIDRSVNCTHHLGSRAVLIAVFNWNSEGWEIVGEIGRLLVSWERADVVVAVGGGSD